MEPDCARSHMELKINNIQQSVPVDPIAPNVLKYWQIVRSQNITCIDKVIELENNYSEILQRIENSKHMTHCTKYCLHERLLKYYLH